jgi:hypothetical protein
MMASSSCLRSRDRARGIGYFELPVFGNEEDAADQFKTTSLQFGKDDARRLITGAASPTRRAEPGDQRAARSFFRCSAHAQRYFNILSAYGANEGLFADVGKGYLPKTRPRTASEYNQVAFAFRNSLQHIWTRSWRDRS